jgi:cell division initiation protein
MINAQRLGENVIREAKQKAAEIIRAANMKADDREQRARDDVELAKQEIVTLKSEADSFKRSLMEMYRKHINLISKLPEYNPPAQEENQQPTPQTAAPAQPYAEPAPEPVPYTEPAPAPVAEPEPQATSYYNPAEAAPAPEPTPVDEPAPEKVDTVEFAIAPHPEEPEETAPAVDQLPMEDTRFQPGAGLYGDAPEAAPAPAKRSTRKSPAKRSSRKKASTEPQEELNSPAFDNFEGVDFDS